MTLCKDFTSGLVSLKDFAKGLGVPESTVRTWRNRKDLPDKLFIKIGNSIFIKTKTYERWVEEEA